MSPVFRSRSPVASPRRIHSSPGLIGGQAVNFWAGLYAFRESALGELKSFTNEDIDFKGDRSDVEHIAAQLKLRAVLPGKVGMTALAGSIPFTWGDIESNIDVV